MGNYCFTTSSTNESQEGEQTTIPPSPVVPSPVVPSPVVPSPVVPLPLEEKKYCYEGVTYENTPEFTFKGLRRKVKILRILDGDTVDIGLYHEGLDSVYRHRVRLYGIDTPEKRPSLSDPNRQAEIAASLKAKHALEQRIQENDSILLALFHASDKYGRLMCTFYDKNGEDINQWMVQQGHAYEYHGKTKKKFEVSFSQ